MPAAIVISTFRVKKELYVFSNYSKSKNQYLDLEVPSIQNTTEMAGRNKTRLRCLNIDSEVPKCEVSSFRHVFYTVWTCLFS